MVAPAVECWMEYSIVEHGENLNKGNWNLITEFLIPSPKATDCQYFLKEIMIILAHNYWKATIHN